MCMALDFILITLSKRISGMIANLTIQQNFTLNRDVISYDVRYIVYSWYREKFIL